MRQCLGITGSLKTGSFKRCSNSARHKSLFCYTHRLQPLWFIFSTIFFIGSLASIYALFDTVDVFPPHDTQMDRVTNTTSEDENLTAEDLYTREIEKKPIPQLIKLVSMLEGFLASEEAEIKAPDYIKDRITGEFRKVDISIRKKLGSFPILIIINFKDESVIDDVQWIEQVAQKRNDIGASKAVVVSEKQISNSALHKASFLNIEYRLINQITLDDIADWCTVRYLKLWKYQADFLRVSFRAEYSKQRMLNQFIKNKLSSLKLPNDLELFKNIEDGKNYSLNQVWQGILSNKQKEIYQGVMPNDIKLRRSIMPNFRNPKSHYQILTDTGPIDILGMEITCDLWIEEIQIPATIISNYSSKDHPLFDTVGWEFEVNGKKSNLNIHRDSQTGQMYITGNNISETEFKLIEQEKDTLASDDK